MNGLDRNPIQHWQITELFDIQVLWMYKHYSWMYLVTCWDVDFMTGVMESRMPLIFPIVNYKETWDYNIFIIY